MAQKSGKRRFSSGTQASRTAKPNKSLPVLEETAVLMLITAIERLNFNHKPKPKIKF